MRFIHLSDLHLGKRVNEFSMIEDQQYILKKIINIIDDKKPDAVVIAGDVYDKGIPPVEAVELFDDFLTSLAKRSIPVLIISGNHDSAERITFGAKLMESSKIYFAPVYDGKTEPVVLEDKNGPVNFYLLPFIKPSSVRPYFPEEKIETCNDAVALAISQMKLNNKERNILVAHQFVTGAQTCQSEELFAGGSDNVDATLFDAFDYVALGHLHGPQKIIKETVRYSGTPLKYSFSECNHNKGVHIVDVTEKENVTLETIPLIPKHDMRELRGSYEDIMLKSNYEGTPTDDYLHITLTDEMDIPEGFAKIRTVYKNLMKLDYDNTRTRTNNQIDNKVNAMELKPEALFDQFFELQNNRKMNEQQMEILTELVDEIWGGEK